MFAEARYITNEKGERIGVVVDPEEIESILNIYHQLTHVSELLRDSISELVGPDTVSSKSVNENRELARVEEKLAELGEWLEELEDLQADRVYYESMQEIESGDDKPTLLSEAIPRIEREREALRRRGEL